MGKFEVHVTEIQPGDLYVRPDGSLRRIDTVGRKNMFGRSVLYFNESGDGFYRFDQPEETAIVIREGQQ